MTHSAALIAGGKSTRMGRNKAALRRAGCPLWLSQLATLAATQPAEIFVAGKCPAIPAGTVEVLADLRLNCGPLGGIAAALQRARAPWVMVLAVDMPAMNPDFLLRILKMVERNEYGVVPFIGDACEPLAAVYPKSALPLALRLLDEGRFALRHFVAAACAAGLVEPMQVDGIDTVLFSNINNPVDAAARGFS